MPNLRELPYTLKQKLGFPPSLVHQRLLERELVIRRGTIRRTADKDDAWLLACAMHAHCVIDVGANIGQAALVMLLPGTIERLLLIDPNPDALSLAADNLIRNNLSWNASFICAFVSDKNDEIKRFWTVGTGSAGSVYPEHAKTAAKKNSHFDVRTVTIDAIIEHFNLTPDLIKIDVEGAEYQVLLGATECAAMQHTRFFVEMHSNSKLPMVTNAAQILEWCSKHDYQTWYLTEHAMLEHAEQLQHRGRCHLLLQPKAWEFPEWLKRIEQSAPLQEAFASVHNQGKQS